jgi:hypothetical protein
VLVLIHGWFYFYLLKLLGLLGVPCYLFLIADDGIEPSGRGRLSRIGWVSVTRLGLMVELSDP